MLKRPFLAKNERENTTTLVALTITTTIVIEKQQQIAENVPSCNYCAATIVARPLRTTVKGKKPAFRVIVKSNLRSLIQRIQESGRVSGRKTFIDSCELLASCHVLT